jgi:CRP-like cAMP-binding protein
MYPREWNIKVSDVSNKMIVRGTRNSEFGRVLMPIFNPDELKKFSRFYSQIEIKGGQQVPFEKNGKAGFVIIEQGYARLAYRLDSSTHTVMIVGPQDIIGCESYLVPNSYVATAIENMSALYFDHELFYILKNRLPELNTRLLERSIYSLIERDERLFTLENRSVKARVAGTLFSLCKKFGKKRNDNTWEIFAPIDRKTMAELSGTVIETLARTLTEFEADGVILRDGKNIVIVDEAELIRKSII